MATSSQSFTDLADEFSLLAETASEAGVPGASPRVRRGWVNVPTGGHVSAVIWGAGPPEVVLLHDIGQSARVWDPVVLALARPAAAIDLPGHGRSDWRRDGRYEPGRLAAAVGEAIGSFAPKTRLVVGSGLGGLTALAAYRKQPRRVPAVALVTTPATARLWAGPERFASREEAFAALANQRPGRTPAAVRREILYELIPEPDGAWIWRHHPGNLPAPDAVPGGTPGDGRGSGRDELAQLPIPVTQLSTPVSQPAALAAALGNLLLAPAGTETDRRPS
jgi:pimeloyl-ACP methyl ester carboxylesterase